MTAFFSSFYESLIVAGRYLQPILLLAIRLYWGWSFFQGGKSKLEEIDSIIGYFGQMGIPFPVFSAYLVAIVEMIGGIALFLGLGARLFAIPLIVTMIMAYWWGHYEALVNVFNDHVTFTQQSPFNYLLASLIIFAFGPGAISIDGIIKRWILKRFRK